MTLRKKGYWLCYYLFRTPKGRYEVKYTLLMALLFLATILAGEAALYLWQNG